MTRRVPQNTHGRVMLKDFELKLSDGSVVVWSGTDGEDAAQRYVASHINDSVIAYRNADRHGVFIADISKIVQ